MTDQEGEPWGSGDQGIRVGFSDSSDAEIAAERFYRAVWQPGMELAVFFCSPSYDLPALEQALARRFGDLPLVGCTTAGEITPSGYRHGCLTGFSLGGPDFSVAVRVLDRLCDFELNQGHSAATSARDELSGRGRATDGNSGFGFLLIDAMSLREEWVAHALHVGLEDIQLFGGSAGDGVALGQNPRVYHDGRFQQDCAVFMLVNTRRAFNVIKTENYRPGDAKLVITEAQPEQRLVREINGERAAVEYAELVGVEPENLDGRVFAANPVGLLQGDGFYMRSIGWLEPDDVLHFACAIDEGLVLTQAVPGDFVAGLGEAFRRVRAEIGQPSLTIACDCLFRLFEMNRQGIRGAVSDLMRENAAIGFNTYGEQFNAMHVNQTLTAVAIGHGVRRGRDG